MSVNECSLVLEKYSLQLPYVCQGRSADLLLQFRHFLQWTSEEGSPGVSDGLATTFAEGGAIHVQAVHLKLPIPLPRHRNICEVPIVTRRVRATKDDFAWK